MDQCSTRRNQYPLHNISSDTHNSNGGGDAAANKHSRDSSNHHPHHYTIGKCCGAAPITIQSQLWLEGQQPEADDEERVVEMELGKEQGDSQEEEGGTQEDSQEEKESQTQGELKDEQKEKVSGEEESSEEDSEDSVGRKRKGNSQSTLTSKEDLEK